MTCEVLSGERFERVLARRATNEDIELLRTHLDTACEACLERLAGVDDEVLLRALAGPKAELSPAEADEMFAAARPVNRRLISRLMRWPLAAAAALLIAATTGVFLFREPPDLRDKAGPIHVELFAFAARKVGDKPVIDRSLANGDRISPDERVLFRHRLISGAHLYLLVQRGQSVELLFSEYAQTGEHELAKQGQALALDPTGLGPKLRIIAIASAEPLDGGWLSCTVCGRAEIELVVE